MKQLAVLLLTLSLFSCKQDEKQTYSVINGTIENNSAENVLIYGPYFTTAIPISREGKFSDTLHLKNNGFYQLYVGGERTEVYLEKGKSLTVNLNATEFDESLKYSGDLASVNNYLAEKLLLNEKLLDYKELYPLGEDEFMKKLDTNQKTLDSLYATHNITNEDFKKMLADEDTYNKAALIENYQSIHLNSAKEGEKRVSDILNESLKGINFKDTLAFRNSTTYQMLLNTHFNRLVGQEIAKGEDNDFPLLYLKKVDSSLPDGYAKDKMMAEFLQYGLKPNKNIDEVFNIYKNSNPNPENLAKITELYNKFQAITEGKPSPTFNYENHKGGTTSLADLKGKYVYIDVWATWCGPCLREVPALKETEKNYDGKNIQFVSISIDEPKDYDKWKEMVTEKSLGGTQLIADNNWRSKFVEDYGISGIPRFILIDPQGNIVSGDAPRPSDPMLRKMLDGLL